MFENKRRKRRRRFVIFFIVLVFFVAFSIGYYINIRPEDESNSLTKISQNLKIPDRLKNVTNVDNDNAINEDETNIKNGYILNENYKVKYITLFTICGHSIEREISLPLEFSGLTEEEFMEKNSGWDLLEINDKAITLSKTIDTYCPKHFIISLDGQYIAIYVYDENGEKILKEKTDINIATLTPEDQEILKNGIVADTVDDLEQKLEGFSN